MNRRLRAYWRILRRGLVPDIKPLRAVLVGDVGPKQGIFHVGDEAMMLAAIGQLRRRGFRDIWVVSANARDSEERFGVMSWEVPALDQFASVGALEEFLDALNPGLDKQPPIAAPWSDLLRIIESSNLAIITGGGNLNDSWALAVVLRRIFSEMAHLAGTPLAVSSQSIGPHLTGNSWRSVHRIIELSECVGVREAGLFHTKSPSLEKLRHDKVKVVPDDAMFLLPPKRLNERQIVPELENKTGYVIVSFHSYPGELRGEVSYFKSCVQLVRDALEVTNLPVVLLPQEGNLNRRDENQCDVLFLQEIQDSFPGKPVFKAVSFTVDECLTLISRSKLVISTRYHPVVWALGNGVQACALSVDDYTKAKIYGVMKLFGVEDFFQDHRQLTFADLTNLVAHAWSSRHETEAKLRGSVASRKVLQDEWWDSISELAIQGRGRSGLLSIPLAPNSPNHKSAVD